MTRPSYRFFVAFLAPAFLLYSVFVAWPAARALLYSLQQWDGLSAPRFVGLENFAAIFAPGSLFLDALRHSFLLLVFGGGATLLLSLTLAVLLHRRVRGTALFRIVFFFPNVLAAVAAALIWVLLYSVTEFGVVNGALRGLDALAQSAGLPGLGLSLPIAFLDSRNLVYSIMPMLVWMFTGFYMILFLAAMESIPESYYEVAKLEGVPPLRQFFFITLPLMRDVLIVGIVFLLISVMKFFDPVWVMENQRPNRASHVTATVLYQKVFSEFNIGYGAAVAVMLFVLVLFGSLLSLRFSHRERIEY